MANIVPDEKNDSLRDSIVISTTQFRVNPTKIHVDNATGFLRLKNDTSLQQKGIELDFGHIKNPNKNALIDKGIQELEVELLKTDPSGSPVTNDQLQHP